MATISSIKARQILDSRGNPTVEVDVMLSDGSFGRAAVPSGASTGALEALELRDGDKSKYGGKGVSKAVENVNTTLKDLLSGMDVSDQRAIDQKMIDADGTEHKSQLGANAILGVSLAVCRAAAASAKKPLYVWVREVFGLSYDSWMMPTPMMNIINGGKHAEGSTDIQEFMILPTGASSMSEAIRYGAEIFHSLKKVLLSHGYTTEVGDEGGYAPILGGNKRAFEMISEAVEKAGYVLGKDVYVAVDVAASSFYENGSYNLATENKVVNPQELSSLYEEWCSQYPIISIEDPFFEEDMPTTSALTAKIGNTTQIVGDDLFVTNVTLLQKGIDEKSGNAILIKVNQIGSLTETVDAVLLAQKSGFNTVMSHRSGETEDTTIADLAVALNCGQIKTGSLSRSDRVAKYNQLIRIAEELGDKAVYAGMKPFEKYNR